MHLVPTVISILRRSLILLLAMSLIVLLAVNCQAAEVHELVKPQPVESPVSVDETPPVKRPKVALALGGGGCKALAQIGVLKVFEANHIPIDCIVGTSAGAVIGGLYAGGVPLSEIEQMALDGSLQKAMMAHVVPRVIALPFKRLLHMCGKKPYGGLTDGSKLVKYLRKRMPADFSGMKIPFGAIATDLQTGETAMLSEGDPSIAILASSALPPMVRPVAIKDTIYIDGGLKANLPTHYAQATGADIVIAVPADAPIRHKDKQIFTSIRAVAGRVVDIMEAEIDKHRWKEAELVIYPEVADTPGMTKDPAIVRKTIAAGESAATKELPHIKTMLNMQQSAYTY